MDITELRIARKYLSQSEIKKAISVTVNYLENEGLIPYQDRLTLISGQFNKNDKDYKLGITNDLTIFNRSIMNLLELLRDIENEVLERNVHKESFSQEQKNEIDQPPKVSEFKKLRILYESNELFLSYFNGINQQLQRILLSDALDNETLNEFRQSLERSLDQLVELKEKVMDLDKVLKRKKSKSFLRNDIFIQNKYLVDDAERLIDFVKNEMSLLELSYAFSETRKVTMALKNPIRIINTEVIAYTVGILFFVFLIWAMINTGN